MSRPSSDTAVGPPGRDYGGQSRAERQAQRREALIAAGVRVFGHEGFRAATVKALCEAAGLTQRYFYESFGNREQLLQAVYKRLVTDIERDIRAAMPTDPTDTDVLWEAALRLYFQRMADPLIARIVLIEIFGVSARIDRTYRATTLNFAQLTETLIARRFPAAPSSSTGGTARLRAMGLVGSTIHIAMYWYLNGYRESEDEVVASALALYRAVAHT